MKKGFTLAAFTLAEVLITLAIIGVVAALTIPSIVHNARKHNYEVTTKKFYSSLNKAVRQYMADEGVYDLRLTKIGSDDEEIRLNALNDFVRKYFNVIKECDRSNADECFSKKFKNIHGEVFDSDNIMFNGDNTKAFILSDGTVFSLQPWGPIYVQVDINGKSNPNTVGYDIWNMDIFYDGSIDESSVDPESRKTGRAKEIRQDRFESVCKDEQGYGGCFGHLLEKGFKIDY